MFREEAQLQRGTNPTTTTWFARAHIDPPLLAGVLLLCAFGLFVLYSATGQSSARTMAQAVRLGVALVAMITLAQIPPVVYRRWAWAGYALGLALLLVVLIAGVSGKGAQRWIDIGFRFQP
ncbi:MAG: FtsW/RodA/SpoVE family cell cycle protein, partial [Pseudomonadota bacterium]